jgi:pyochelin biosynthesis protein PchC
MATDRRLRRPVPRPYASLRLLCLPHAGGSASLYRGWADLLPPHVESVLYCPPGREDRIAEPFPADFPSMVADLADAVAPLLDRPWAVFGHSMGAAVGHELALRVIRDGHRPPSHLFVSAREAPQHHRPGATHLLDDAALCDELVQLGGTDAALMAMPELRSLVLPKVREDYRLIENYRPRNTALLPCPVTALAGIEDRELTLQEAEGWQDCTTGAFELLTFPGGHFYLSDQPSAVVNSVLRSLAGSIAH